MEDNTGQEPLAFPGIIAHDQGKDEEEQEQAQVVMHQGEQDRLEYIGRLEADVLLNRTQDHPPEDDLFINGYDDRGHQSSHQKAVLRHHGQNLLFGAQNEIQIEGRAFYLHKQSDDLQ